MDNFDLRHYLYNNPLLQEEIEDGGAQEKEFDAAFDASGEQIAAAIKKLAVKAKKAKEKAIKEGKSKQQINEIAVISIVAAILTGNALLGFISKLAKKLFKKLGYKKGEDIAEKIHKFAHDNEAAFQSPIKRIVGLIVKDKETAELLTKAIYAIVVLVMAGQAGSGAVDAVKNSDWFSAAYKTLKTIAKSDEVKANAAPILLKLIS